MTFFLQSELTISNGETVEKNLYETVLLVDMLEQEEGEIIYDKELKMNFINTSKRAAVYKIELYKINLVLSENLEKSSDFTRRLMLRYDWIEPKVGGNGKVTDMQNTKELQKVWYQLKENILADYEGDVVIEYLEEIEEKMKEQDFILSPMSQYFFFGLLFPGIPATHFNEWSNTRNIEISDYEEEVFQETISFDRAIDNLRLYQISGNVFPNSSFILENFSGLIRVKKGETLPVQADVTINYKIHNKSCQWIFTLEQY